jgi:hypothetical protein
MRLLGHTKKAKKGTGQFMKKKLIILGVLSLFVLSVFGFEYWNSTRYVLTVISQEPQKVEADGQTTVNLSLKVATKNGKVCASHDIYGISMNGGGFKAYRVKTDENGIARFVYIPYKESAFQKADDVKLIFQDLSNSYIIRVPAEADYNIALSPYSGAGSGGKVDNIFG